MPEQTPEMDLTVLQCSNCFKTIDKTLNNYYYFCSLDCLHSGKAIRDVSNENAQKYYKNNPDSHRARALAYYHAHKKLKYGPGKVGRPKKDAVPNPEGV